MFPIKNRNLWIMNWFRGLISCVSEDVLYLLLCIHNVGMEAFVLYGWILCVSEDVLSVWLCSHNWCKKISILHVLIWYVSEDYLFVLPGSHKMCKKISCHHPEPFLWQFEYAASLMFVVSFDACFFKFCKKSSLFWFSLKVFSSCSTVPKWKRCMYDVCIHSWDHCGLSAAHPGPSSAHHGHQSRAITLSGNSPSWGLALC